MSSRKCIYTGKDAATTDKVIPKKGGDESHNWANSVPCSKEYKAIKALRPPNELEMEVNRVFKKLELALLDVQFYQDKMVEIQSILIKNLPKVDKKPKKSKKDKEVEIAHKEKEIKELSLDKVLDKKKVLW